MASVAVTLPPELREGDRLTSAEFLRRWEAMPGLRHAELINGVVYCMPSPVSVTHGSPHHQFSGWTWYYAQLTPGVDGCNDTTWVMGAKDVPQPDVALRIHPDAGGQSGKHGDYGEGAPELIVEVTASSLSRDLGAKLQLYQRTGVREYISVLPNTKQIVWRQLVRGRYREMLPDADGLLRSRIFPGLWLDPQAVWNGTTLLTALQHGLQSPEHAAFVRKLARHK